MFGEPGGLYVYFTYGMHWCANLVCGPAGSASAVLLRAGEVIDGLDVARARRPGVLDSYLAGLARGPARLTMTLALGRDQNGLDAVAQDSPLVLRKVIAGSSLIRSGSDGSDGSDGSIVSTGVASAAGSSAAVVRTGPRVGVSGPGGDATAYPWRFWLEGEATVSAYRPGKVAPSKPGARSAHP